MQVGMKCSRGLITHDECRKCSLRPSHPCGVTTDVLELMRTFNSNEPDALSFTPSRLLNMCERQAVLMGRSDYYTDVRHAWDTTRGNMMHALVERTGVPPGYLDVIREVRLETTLDVDGKEIKFTGKSDFIGVTRQEGDTMYVKIIDYKTRRYINADFTDLAQDEVGKKYIKQINMYRWLVERALPKAINRGVTVVVEELEIAFFDMSQCVRFSSAADISYNRKTYKSFPMYETPRTEEWIRKMIRTKLKARESLPPVLSGYPDFWLCKRCSVASECKTLKEEQGL